MNSGYGSPGGNVAPGSAERSGNRSSSPTLTLSLVQRGGTQRVHPAKRPRLDGLTRGNVPGIETALKTHLDGCSGTAGLFDHLYCALDIRCDGLFTEHRQAGAHASHDVLRMSVRRRGDDQRVDAGVQQDIWRLGGLNAQPIRDLDRTVAIGVCHDHRVDRGEPTECVSVERPDAPNARESDTHAVSSRLV